MELSNFTIAIFFIFIPGLICTILLQQLTYFEKESGFFFIIHSFILGIVCYLLYTAIFLLIVKLRFTSEEFELSFLNAILIPDYLSSVDASKEVTNIITEVMYASALSVIVALLLSAIINLKLFQRFAQFIQVTKRFGDVDVWSYIHNSPNKSLEWVYVRDIKYNLVYYGWVNAFSETFKENELLIRDVIVYNNTTGAKLYKTPALYITRNTNELTIEFPDVNANITIKEEE